MLYIYHYVELLFVHFMPGYFHYTVHQNLQFLIFGSVYSYICCLKWSISCFIYCHLSIIYYCVIYFFEGYLSGISLVLASLNIGYSIESIIIYVYVFRKKIVFLFWKSHRWAWTNFYFPLTARNKALDTA